MGGDVGWLIGSDVGWLIGGGVGGGVAATAARRAEGELRKQTAATATPAAGINKENGLTA